MAASPGCVLPGTDLFCLVGEVAGAGAGAVKDNVLSSVAETFVEGFTALMKATLTLWTRTGEEELGGSAAAIAAMRAETLWLVGAIALGSLLVAAARLALTRKSAPAADAARGLATLVLVTGAAVPATTALWRAGDAYSQWVLGRAGGEQLGERMLVLIGALTNGDLAIGAAAVIVLCGIGILSTFGQIALMVVRVGVLTLLAGLLPLLAAGSGTQSGRATFQRAVSWVVAFALYKPLAATVYATAFWIVGTGTDLLAVLSGLALICLSIVALPALLRLVTPAVGAVASAGGGGGGLYASAMVVATGARAVSGRAPGSASRAPTPRSTSPAGPSGARAATGAAMPAAAAAPGATAAVSTARAFAVRSVEGPTS
jgi:type IV secretion system protein TrbL